MNLSLIIKRIANTIGAFLIVLSYWGLWDLLNTVMQYWGKGWRGFYLPFFFAIIENPHFAFDFCLTIGLLGFLLMKL